VKFRFCIILIILLQFGFAAERDFKGQLSLQGSGWNKDGIWDGGIGAQYIPNLRISNQLSPMSLVDFEVSVYGYINKEAGEASNDFRPYRFNLRYATQQSEAQIGLQKINFGPAQLLRSLMWFDRQSPTDPMNIAEGVWGLRYKYIFLNNANVWLWGLLCGDETKGYETMSNDKITPEYGGRVQIPVPRGEVALTTHHRDINRSDIRFTGTAYDYNYTDNRLALDGRWDVVVGAWFEAAVQNIHGSGSNYFTKMLTLGTDYTFGIGNGLYVLGEHMITQTADELLSSNREYQLSALMINYPLGMFDNLSLMAFYSWDTEDVIQYIAWQRSYDKFSINMALFHFPDTQFSTINVTNGDLGVRLMLIYNH